MDDLTMRRIKEFERKCMLHDKFDKKNFLMANIFIECCKREIDMVELLNELSAFLSEQKFLTHFVLFNAEFITEYFAVSLNCSSKLFVKPHKETITELLKLFSVDYGNYTVEYENNRITSIHIPLCFNGISGGLVNSLNASCIYRVCNGNDFYYGLDIDPYIFGSSVQILQWNNISLDKSGQTFSVSDHDGILANYFEKECEWSECAQHCSFEDEQFNTWFERLYRETKEGSIRWKKRYSTDELNIRHLSYHSYSKDMAISIYSSDCPEDFKCKNHQRERFMDTLFISNNVDYVQSFEPEYEETPYMDTFTHQTPKYLKSLHIQKLITFIEQSIENDTPLPINLREKELSYEDVMVVANSMHCREHNHYISPYRGLVPLLTTEKKRIEYQIYVGYCSLCRTYTVFKYDYLKMLETGTPLCLVINYGDPIGQKAFTPFKYKSQSVLNALGYTVEAKSELSDDDRRQILVDAVNSGVTQLHDVLDFLQWLVATRETQPKYAAAVARWKADIEYIKEYKKEERPEINIKSMKVRK